MRVLWKRFEHVAGCTLCGKAPLVGAIAGSMLLIAASVARADVVTQWNQQVVTSGGPQTQRTFAMVHIAMFDAVNGIEQRYTPYLMPPAVPVGASAEAAAAAAAHGVLARLFPSQAAMLATALAASLAAVPPGPDRDAECGVR